ncbi:MAG TPA: amino acid adenylation domain-containing protein, partial [Longimicrobiaceae bacterium]|nr:amino acid adenylation domain-containing protein [Longimicrobiaceae bacterium]
KTHGVLAELLRHEHASLALAQRCSGVAAPAPLFTSLLNYRYGGRRGGAPQADRTWDGIRTVRAQERSNYPLTLAVDDLGEDGFRLVARVQESVEPRRVCALMHTALERLVEALEVSPGRSVGSIDVLPEEERRQVAEAWNATAAAYPRDTCVHQLFERQVERTPDAVALAYEDQRLTFAELNRRANRLAHHLHTLGVGPDARVGICVERSVEMVVALLAILKAGGAYVALDPEYPADRLHSMLQDSAPVVLLTQEPLAERFAGMEIPCVALDTDASSWAGRLESDPDPGPLTPEHLVYVIYTSGSTGAPKGVMNVHRNVVNRITAIQAAWALEAHESVLQNASLSFDVSAYEFFWPLMVGARVVMTRPEGHRDPGYLVETIRRNGVGTASFVPSMLQIFLEHPEVESCTSLVRVPCGGEALPPSLVQRFYERLPNARLYNRYGPSEAATAVTGWSRAGEETRGGVPIGRPMANTRVYVLDGRSDLAPAGVVGELYIGGAGVGRGYLGRTELTAARFVPDPFGKEAGARLYRTGDLARWLADGRIEFLGRNDFQVKVRGFRVELGEIEAVLREHTGVREAVVVAREDTPGDRRLVAYYVGEEGHEVQALRVHLSERLPEYMVPAAYVRLEEMPLTPNGKLDRRALPAPEGDAYARRGYEAPVGEVEQALAEIWAEVLRVEHVGRWDHFFELGGHSLLAVRVVSRVRQRIGVEVPLGEVFRLPVLAEYARAVATAARAELPPIEPVGRTGPLPLSFAQQRLWFLEQLGGAGNTYHIQRRLRLRGELDRGALVRALERIVARHEVLRTTFPQVGGEPVQRIWDEGEQGFALAEHDLAGYPETEEELRRLLAEEGRVPFDLERGPLIRGCLVGLGEGEHVLQVTMHHIVSDGWSMEVFTRELSELYGAYRRGEADPLPALPVQYGDYAVWQRRWMEGEVLRQQAEYWKRTLSGAPELLELPTDHPRPAQQDFAGSFVRVELDEALTAGLKALSQRQGTTLFMTLLAGWAVVLSRLSGQEDLVIGTPTANRGRREIEGLIGFFVNTLALRLELSGEPSVGELLERVRE